MLKRLVCWSVGLLLAAGGGLAMAQGTEKAAPGEKGAPGLSKEMRGYLVRVDPEKGTVVLRTGKGTEAKEQEYRVGKTTRYFGKDKKSLSDGLKYSGWKANTPVWFRTSGAAADRNLGELRLGPTVGTPVPPPGGTGKPGGS